MSPSASCDPVSRRSRANGLQVVHADSCTLVIEEMDIDDLTEALLEVEKADIRTVFENLLSGSENHLAAFESRL